MWRPPLAPECPVNVILEFLPEGFSAGQTFSTLKVYVAMVYPNQRPVEETLVGRHLFVFHFLFFFSGEGVTVHVFVSNRLHTRPPG